MLSWVICSWIVGGAAPPCLAFLFSINFDLEFCGFFTTTGWSCNKWNFYRGIKWKSNWIFHPSQTPVMMIIKSMIRHIWNWCHDENRLSLECWIFWSLFRLPDQLSSPLEPETFLVEHQAIVHSPPSVHHLSTEGWVERRYIAEMFISVNCLLYCYNNGVKRIDPLSISIRGSNLNYSTHRNPFVPDDLINAESLLGIGLQTAFDQLDGVFGDVGPLGVGELVLTRPDTSLHPGGDGQTVIGVKWRETTQSTTIIRGSFIFCEINDTYKMYMITPRLQISQDLSYFSGPSTSGAVKKRPTSSNSSSILWSIAIAIDTHPRNMECSRASVMYLLSASPWQIRNLSISVLQNCLKCFTYNFRRRLVEN